MKAKFQIISIFLFSLLISNTVLANTQAVASVSANKVLQGDMFILTVLVNDTDSDYQLDTRVLEKDFHVFRPSQSQSTQYINGTMTKKTQWQVRLQAKASGTFTIPALKLGKLRTEPITISVGDPAQAPTGSQQNELLFIENSIDKQQVYIGQSFIYSSTLYIAKNSNELDLAEPQFIGAQVSVFGKDRNSQTVREGVRYNTITRQYKITPTLSGDFEIDSPLLTGTVRKVVSRDRWQNQVVAEPINIRGARLNISVKAIPTDFKGDWLVSEDLRLIEDNDLSSASYHVGDPITRSITLQIASVDKDKMPNINLNYPASLRVYPDQDQLEEGQAQGLNYGVRIIKHAIIADEAGTLTLPEITLNWFNSRTNQAEVATLPAQTLTILPAEQTAQPSGVVPHVDNANVTPTAQVIVKEGNIFYWQLSTFILLLLLMALAIYHLAYRRQQRLTSIDEKITVAPLDEHYLMLKNSLKIHDAPKCYSLLLKYAQAQNSDIKCLADWVLKSHLDQAQQHLLKHEVEWLQICCSDKTQLWNGNKLAELIAKHVAQKDLKRESNSLDLNP